MFVSPVDGIRDEIRQLEQTRVLGWREVGYVGKITSFSPSVPLPGYLFGESLKVVAVIGFCYHNEPLLLVDVSV